MFYDKHRISIFKITFKNEKVLVKPSSLNSFGVVQKIHCSTNDERICLEHRSNTSRTPAEHQLNKHSLKFPSFIRCLQQQKE